MTTATTGDTVELTVSGMTCAACATRIERKLNKLDGVRATVNYATERAIVHLPDELRADDAVRVVRDAGYDATVAQQAEDGKLAHDATVAGLRRRLMVAAVLAIPLGNLSISLALVPSLRFTGWEALCVLLSLPVVGYAAWPFHRAALRNLGTARPAWTRWCRWECSRRSAGRCGRSSPDRQDRVTGWASA